MLYIGCHLSSSKGYLAMGKDAVKINANTFQFFTRNPRGGNAKAIVPSDVEAYLAFAAEHKITRILAHAPYTLNACSADKNLREFARATMADDLDRMEYTPGNCYNFHPGSHVKQGVETGISYIADMLNAILKPEQTTTVLLETMAGKGSEIGRTFEELAQIYDGVVYNDKLRVCFDTCHTSDSGYDIIHHFDDVIDEFDRLIGKDQIAVFHINDSKNIPGAAKDRHANIGFGHIGFDAIHHIVHHKDFMDIPKILETPYIPSAVKEKKSYAPYKYEIRMLKEGIFHPELPAKILAANEK